MKSPFLDKLVNRIFPARLGLSKVGQLRYRLLKEGTGFLTGLLFLAALAYIAGSWATGLNEDRNKLNNKVNNTIADVNILSAKLTKAEKSLPVYRQLTASNETGQVLLDRQQVGEMLDGLKEQYFLPALKVTLAPVKNMEGSAYKNASMQGIMCDMALSIEGVTDEHILQVLHQINDLLPGHMMKITTLSINRTGDPNEQEMNALIQSGKSALVKSDVKLIWQGMKLNSAAPAPAKPPEP